MQISQIVVKYGRTYNLGDYNNVRPEIILTAELAEDDDLDVVLAKLRAQARQEVEEEIDRSLEAQGSPPEFYNGPCFDALRVDKEKYIAIVPHNIQGELPGEWGQIYSPWTKRRLETLKNLCAKKYSSHTIVDFSHGDFSELPEVGGFRIHIVDNSSRTNDRYILLLNDHISPELPDSWSGWWVNRETHYRFEQSLVDELTIRAEEKNFVFINCLDGDLSKIPEINLKQEWPLFRCE